MINVNAARAPKPGGSIAVNLITVILRNLAARTVVLFTLVGANKRRSLSRCTPAY